MGTRCIMVLVNDLAHIENPRHALDAVDAFQYLFGDVLQQYDNISEKTYFDLFSRSGLMKVKPTFRRFKLPNVEKPKVEKSRCKVFFWKGLRDCLRLN